MRRLIVVLVAFAALAVPVALAKGDFPEKIALPNGFAPEGIETRGNTFYTGSVATGAICVGDLRKGTGADPRPGRHDAEHARRDRDRVRPRPAVGRRRRLRQRAGLRREDGRAPDELQFATPPGTFINDVVVTKKAAYFTDSQRPVLYRVAIAKDGAPGAVTTIPLGGEYVHVAGQFNLNGIVATKNGKALIAVQSVSKKLFADRPVDRRREDDRHRHLRPHERRRAAPAREDALRRPEQGEQGRRLPALARPDAGDASSRRSPIRTSTSRRRSTGPASGSTW